MSEQVKIYRPALQKAPHTKAGYVAYMSRHPHPHDSDWSGEESRQWVRLVDYTRDIAGRDARMDMVCRAIGIREGTQIGDILSVLHGMFGRITECDARIAELRGVYLHAQECVVDWMARAERAEAELARLRSLVDGAMDIVELWKAETPSQIKWRSEWLAGARDAVGSRP
jgi:hypothetical protein